MAHRRRRSARRIKRVPRLQPAKRPVTRIEFNRVVKLLNERGDVMAGLVRDVDMQFKRLAQLQAEIDMIKKAWERSTLS